MTYHIYFWVEYPTYIQKNQLDLDQTSTYAGGYIAEKSFYVPQKKRTFPLQYVWHYYDLLQGKYIVSGKIWTGDICDRILNLLVPSFKISHPQKISTKWTCKNNGNPKAFHRHPMFIYSYYKTDKVSKIRRNKPVHRDTYSLRGRTRVHFFSFLYISESEWCTQTTTKF